jgi:hypothetical protein
MSVCVKANNALVFVYVVLVLLAAKISIVTGEKLGPRLI